MKTQLSLSVDSIADEVLAESALRHHLSPDHAPVLSRDRIGALRLMIHAAFSRLCLRLMGCITDCSCGCTGAGNEDEGVLLSLTIEHEPTPTAMMWVHALEHSVAMDVMCEAMCGVDSVLAGEYERRARDLVQGVLRDVSMSGYSGAAVVRWFC